MRDALLEHQDPEIAEWASTKGMDNGERELRRVYDQSPNHRRDQPPRAIRHGAAIPTRPRHPAASSPGRFFEWSGCAWPEVDEAGLRARLYAFLDRCQSKTAKGELKPVKPNAQMVAAVLDALRAAAHLDAAIEPPAWLDGEYRPRPPAHELVACANGLMHLPTEVLLPHTPSFFNHNALNFDYEPYAREPRQWLDFLNQLWRDDPQAVDTLQEIFGYCLTADTSQQKAFALIGPKRSGKGTIGRVFTSAHRGAQLRRADARRPRHEFRTRAADRQARCHHIRRPA